MYLRRNTVRSGPSRHTYVSIGHSTWDHVSRQSIPLAILSLGREDRLDSVAADRLRVTLEELVDETLAERDVWFQRNFDLHCLKHALAEHQAELRSWVSRDSSRSRFPLARLQAFFEDARAYAPTLLFSVVKALADRPKTSLEISAEIDEPHIAVQAALEYLYEGGIPLDMLDSDEGAHWELMAPKVPTKGMLKRWDS